MNDIYFRVNFNDKTRLELCQVPAGAVLLFLEAVCNVVLKAVENDIQPTPVQYTDV